MKWVWVFVQARFCAQLRSAQLTASPARLFSLLLFLGWFSLLKAQHLIVSHPGNITAFSWQPHWCCVWDGGCVELQVCGLSLVPSACPQCILLLRQRDMMYWFGNVHLTEPYAKTWVRGHGVVVTVALLCLGLEPQPPVQHPCLVSDGQGRSRELGCQASFGHCTKQESPQPSERVQLQLCD